MKKLVLLFLYACTTFTAVFSQQEATTSSGRKVILYPDSTWEYAADSLFIINTPISKLEIPQLKPLEVLIPHTAYSLSYNEVHEQANWVAYELTSEETKSQFARTDRFIVDPLVKTGSANALDYTKSGYDRGHLAPAADMGWSSTAMAESFYYSNMSPQYPSFNRGIWSRTEELIRTWADEYRTIYVVTGPVLTIGLKQIGVNKVSVPEYFYKVVLVYNQNESKGIGFVMRNLGSNEPLPIYTRSIDFIEKLTGIDFFPLLPDDKENLIESTLDAGSWIWKSTVTNNEGAKATVSTSSLVKETVKPAISEIPRRTVSVQCSGTTKAGARCRNMTLNTSGRCHLH